MRKLLQNQQDMKISNLRAIFHILYENEPISRTELAKVTGMSPTTISRHIDTLFQYGLLKEQKNNVRKVGRSATLLAVNPDAFYTAGMNIDSSYLHVSILNLKNEVIANRYKKREPGFQEASTCMISLYKLFCEAINDASIAKDQVLGIGVSIAGVMEDDSTLSISSQLEWKDINLKTLIQDVFSIQNVIIGNDCDLALLGEIAVHPEYMKKTVACINIGSGVGSSVSQKGELYGTNGKRVLSELGHVIMDPDGMLCDCGNHGCLQTYLVEDALVLRAKKYDTKISSLGDIHEKWKKGIKWATDLIDQANLYLKLAINMIYCAYDPDIVLIGGESIDNYPDMFSGYKNNLDDYVFYPFKNKIVAETFQNLFMFSVIGAANIVKAKAIDNLITQV